MFYLYHNNDHILNMCTLYILLKYMLLKLFLQYNYALMHQLLVFLYVHMLYNFYVDFPQMYMRLLLL